MLEFIKNFGRRRMIKQMMSEERSKKIANLDQVKHIGIIFQVADEYEWNVLYHFIKVMEGQGKKVSVIGLQGSDQELSFIITHASTIICHEKEDINFWGVPKDEKTQAFTEMHYDLLVDTTEQPNFFGQFITMKTESDLRVARIDTSDEASINSGEIYDLMIQNEGPIDLKEYLNNVVGYLSMIQK